MGRRKESSDWQEQSDQMCATRGCTVLIAAVVQEQCAAAELLIKHGASVNATDHLGMAALHWAVRLDSSSSMICLLISSGADVNQAASAFNGRSLLTAALEQRSQAAAQRLLDAGAHYDSLCLREAVGQGLPAVVQRLLTFAAAGASLNTADEHFQCPCCGNVTALMAAQEAATAKLLLAAGASARTVSSRGNSCRSKCK